jgi:chaperonin GroES
LVHKDLINDRFRGIELAYTATLSATAHRVLGNDVIAREAIVNIKPLGDRIVVRRSESKEKTAGGILLPDSAKDKPQKGKVMATGPGRMLKDGKRQALQVKEGDTVLFTAWAGDEFKENRSGGNILLMREEDVLAVLDE